MPIVATFEETIDLLRLLLGSISSIGNFSGISKSNMSNHVIHFNMLDANYLVSSMLLSNIIRYKRVIFDTSFSKKHKKTINFLNKIAEYLSKNKYYILLDKQKLNKFIKDFKKFYEYESISDTFEITFTMYGKRITHINIDDMKYEFHENSKRSQKAFRYNSLLLEWDKLMNTLDSATDDNIDVKLNSIFQVDNFKLDTDSKLTMYNEKSIQKVKTLNCHTSGDIISLSNTKASMFNIIIARLLIYKEDTNAEKQG